MRSIGTRFLVPFGVLAVLFSIFILYRAYSASQQHARELISQQAALALEFNLAIRDYTASTIRPTMERLLGKDGFIPETMSTSLVSRNIFEEVRQKFPHYIIRFASDDPRNPVNKANPDELRMIEFFRKNRHLNWYTSEIQLDGKRYLAHFVPKWMTKECLHCHGDPKDAPAELVKRYGPTASFHRELGDVVGLDTVAVPVEAVQGALASEMWRQSLTLAAGLALLFGSIIVIFRYVVTQRLTTMARHFNEIAAHPESPGMTPVKVGGSDEIGVLAVAFNTLLEHLRAAHASLEQRVSHRTAELGLANEELRREIADRQLAEERLRESEADLKRAQGVAHVGSWRLDVCRNILVWSDETYRIFGMERGVPLTYESFLDVVHPEDRARVDCAWQAAVKGEPYDIEHRALAGGLVKWVHERAEIEFDAQGHVSVQIGTVQDITDRKRAEQELERRVRETSILNTLSQQMGSTLSPAEVTRAALEGIVAAIAPDLALLFLKEGDDLILGGFRSSRPEFRHETTPTHRVGQCLCGMAVAERRPLYVRNIDRDPRCTWEECRKAGLISFAAVPLRSGEKVLGVLGVAAGGEERDFSEQAPFLETLSNEIAVGLQNSILFEEAMKHGLELGRANEGLRAEIAERERIEAEMDRLRNLLKNIVDSMPSVLIGVDAEGRVTNWNREAQAVTGLAPQDAQGKLLDAILPELTDQMEKVRRAIRQRTVEKAEKVRRSQGGTTRFVDVMVYPLVANCVEGAVIRVDDVTERVRIEEMMIQSEKMLSVGGLAAGMAHEINNPLGAILQAAQNIQRRTSTGLPRNADVARECGTTLESLHAYLEKREVLTMIEGIRESGLRASRIVANMLQFSRTSHSQKVPANLSETINRAVELAQNDYDLKKKYDFRRIEIVRDFAPDLPAVPCSQTEIEQVVLNLLKNSAQAMAGVKEGAPPRITVRTLREGSMARIEVDDNGPGMTEEVQRRIFEPFFTTKDVGAGTGLGLSVSYMIVTNNHKGEVTVESAPGKGARFIVRLPLEAPVS